MENPKKSCFVFLGKIILWMHFCLFVIIAGNKLYSLT